MAYNIDLFTQALNLRFEERDPLRDPSAWKVAPIEALNGRGEYLAPSPVGSLDQRDPAQGRGPVHRLEQYAQGHLELTMVRVDTNHYQSTYLPVDARTLREIRDAAGADILMSRAYEHVTGQLYGKFSLELVSELNTLTAGTALDLGSDDIFAAIAGAQEAIFQKSGRNGSIAYMSLSVANAIRTSDLFRSWGNGTRTGGYATEAQFQDFWAAMGMRVVVDDSHVISSAGTMGNAAGLNLYVLSEDTARTFYSPGSANSVINFEARELVHPNPDGVAFRGDMDIRTKITNPDSGLKIAVTLPA